MVNKIASFFAGLGQFLRGYIIRRRFLRAVVRCERINATATRRHIVISINKRPLILCKADFRDLRAKGVFRREITWAQLFTHRITHKDL